MKEQEQFHTQIGFQCPVDELNPHANFSTRNGRFVCETCKTDFTEEVEAVRDFILFSLKPDEPQE